MARWGIQATSTKIGLAARWHSSRAIALLQENGGGFAPELLSCCSKIALHVKPLQTLRCMCQLELLLRRRLSVLLCICGEPRLLQKRSTHSNLEVEALPDS